MKGEDGYYKKLIIPAIGIVVIAIFVYVMVFKIRDRILVSTVGLVVNSVLTSFLIFVYIRQNSLIDSQKSVQEEQNRLTKSQYTPYVIGPFDLEYNFSESELRFKLANSGEGVAQSFFLETDVEVDRGEHELSIKTYPNPLGRKGDSKGELSVLHPGEERVEFNCSPWVRLVREGAKGGNMPLERALDICAEEGARTFKIKFRVTYNDRFNNNNDPFGRDYQKTMFEFRVGRGTSGKDILESVNH